MEYIKRETALKIIDNYGNTISEDGRVVYQAIRDIVDFICPSADVVEVVHGEWVEEGCHFLVCSKCNFEYDHSGMPDEGLNYCPNCGAKMDGGKE